MTERLDDFGIVVAHALTSYIYNTSPSKFMDDVFGEVHPSYRKEKEAIWEESPTRALGLLDFGNFRKVVVLALERHGKNSLKWVEASKPHFE